MKYFSSIILIVAVVFVQTVHAQTREVTDFVFLKNGTSVVGKITSYIPDSLVSIRTGGGSVYTFNRSQIEKILMDNKTIFMNKQLPLAAPQTKPESLQININKYAPLKQTLQSPTPLKQSIKPITPSLAEIYLEQLASKSKQLRITEGIIYTSMGVTLLISAQPVTRDLSGEGADVLKGFLYGSGAAMCGIGVWQMLAQSDIEDEYASVVLITDNKERNNLARDKMQLLSEKNYGATFTLVWWGLSSTYFFVGKPLKIYESREIGWSIKTFKKDSPYNYVVGSLLGILAISKLIISQEDVIDRYEEAKGTGRDVGIHLQLMRENGIGLRVQYNF